MLLIAGRHGGEGLFERLSETLDGKAPDNLKTCQA